MAMEIMSNYSSYSAQYMPGNSPVNSVKKKETEQTTDVANNSRSKSTTDYMSELAKLAPSVEFGIGSTYSSAKNGKTLTINSQLLNKMQNDPEKEKEIKELIKGVESATKLMDGIYKASGWTVAYRHSYIDENGKYCAIACVRNDFMLNMSDKLREERRENSEKLIEKTKEKAKKEKEELQEKLDKDSIEKEDEKTASNKVEQLLDEKAAISQDGIIYLNDEDMKTIIEIIKEDGTGRSEQKEKTQVGANLDLRI